MKRAPFVEVLTRYLLLLVLGLGNLTLFYTILTPLTYHVVVFIVGLFSDITLVGTSTYIIDGVAIKLVEACIAGAAYYFLCILNLTTPLKAEQRFKSLVFLLGGFFCINVIRIVIFTYLIDSTYFDVAHTLVWYIGSTLVVVGLWFWNVSLFKITTIPVYSDAQRLYKASNTRK